MQCVKVCVGYRSIQQTLYHVLHSAKKTIYLSAPACNFHVVLNLHASLADVIKDRANAGVLIMVLLADGSASEYPVVPQCKVKIAEAFGPQVKDEFLLYTPGMEQLVEGTAWRFPLARVLGKRAYGHQQTYVMVDNQLVMVGSLGLDPSEIPQPNVVRTATDAQLVHVNLFHGVACLAEPTASFCLWVSDNWVKAGCAVPNDNDEDQKEHRQMPLFCGSFRQMATEHEMINYLIVHARESVYIETRYFFSTANTMNTIAKALINRLLQSTKSSLDQDPFRCIIVTNAAGNSHNNDLGDKNRVSQTFQTWSYIQQVLRDAGVSEETQRTRLFMGHLRHKSRSIYVNASVLIQDRTHAWIGQTALHDSDLGCRHSKLSLRLKGDQVRFMLQSVAANHLNPEPCPSVADAAFTEQLLELCHQHKGSLRTLPEQSSWEGMLASARDAVASVMFREAVHAL